jgi:exopolyphosphatase/guanosine-5'-triphosphate,3'-diphosphate pyrophosphatase
MIRASIDIGSNSVLLLAAELDQFGKKISNELLNLSSITSLGKDLDKTKKFHADSMDATFQALSFYKQQLAQIKIAPENVLVTATEAARVAENSNDFFFKIKSELGFDIKIISSASEAYYTALGVASTYLGSDKVVIMDIGGASTEFINIQMDPFKVVESISLPIGSVRATDWMSDNSFEEKTKSIFSQNFQRFETDALVCVAGGMTALGAMYLGLKEFDDKKVDGLILPFESFKLFAADVQKTNRDNLLLLFPFLGKRVDVIHAASKVAIILGSLLKIETINISTRGLRYGTLLSGAIDG